jgi:serine/threonine protein kinase
MPFPDDRKRTDAAGGDDPATQSPSGQPHSGEPHSGESEPIRSPDAETSRVTVPPSNDVPPAGIGERKSDSASRIKDLFIAASELAEGERGPFLDRACSGDTELRRRVETLLSQHAQPTRSVLRAQASTVVLRDNSRDLIGKLVAGDYQVIDKIGEGGMGAVYVAEHVLLKKRVALKVMNADVAALGGEARFMREMQVLGALQHPGIVTVTDARRDQDARGTFHCLVMEYVPGAKSITEYARDKDLSGKHRARLFLQVCDAVAAAHDKGFVHRDLKPNNILVDERGNVRVIDFGIAHVMNADSSLQKREIVGTAAYMSPEQCSGDPRAIDARTDVYALGVVLYELLCGQLPYSMDNKSFFEQMKVVQQVAPADLGALLPEYRGNLADLIRKALAKTPEQRVTSAREFAAELRRYLDGKPLYASSTGTFSQITAAMRGFARTRPIAASLLVLTLCMGLMTLKPVQWLLLERVPSDTWFKAMVANRLAPATSGLSRVKIIRTDIDDLKQLAFDRGIAEAKDNQLAIRKLHGELMGKLAQTDVRAVTWIMGFESNEYAEDFLKGVRALKNKKIPADVWVSPNFWRPRTPIEVTISPKLAEGGVRWGPAALVLSESAPPMIQLALLREGQSTRVSSILGTVLSVNQPGRDFEIHADPVSRSLDIRYRIPTSGAPGQYSQLKQRTRLDSGIEMLTLDNTNPAIRQEFGVLEGDLLAASMLPRIDRASLESAVVSYADVLEASETQLREWFDGKVVLIGRTDGRGGMVISPFDKQQVWVVQFYAAAIDSMLEGRIARVPGVAGELIAVGIGGVLGLGAIFMSRRTVRRLFALSALTILLAAGSVSLYFTVMYVCNPVIPIVAMLASATLAVWIDLRWRYFPVISRA